MCNVEPVSFTCKGALLGGQRAQCQSGTTFDCGNWQVGMTGFGLGICSALRPHLGAKRTFLLRPVERAGPVRANAPVGREGVTG